MSLFIACNNTFNQEITGEWCPVKPWQASIAGSSLFSLRSTTDQGMFRSELRLCEQIHQILLYIDIMVLQAGVKQKVRTEVMEEEGRGG